MQYVNALVHKAANMKIPVCVLPWELKVLKVKYEEVEVIGTAEGENRDIDPAGEYARLQAKHGLSDETRQPFVQIAYGHEHEGKLSAAIEEALAEAEASAELDELAEEVDLDGDGQVERDEIKAKLDELGIEYNNRAHTETLQELLIETLAAIGAGAEAQSVADD